MSGSTSQVLLRTRLTDAQIGQLTELVQVSSGSNDWQSFSLLGQPFTMALCDPDEDEERFDLPGWSPVQAISVCCHCRGRAGDLLLAFISARVAETFSGLIVFGESLDRFTSDPTVLSLDGRYRSAEIGDVLTPAFLAYWAASSEFRMCN